jgi:hypothetical protein
MKPVQHELVRLLHSGLSRNRPQVPVDGECARVRARAHMCHLSIRGTRTGALTRARVAAQARAQEQLSTAMAQMVTQGNIEAEEAAKRKAEEKRAADEARAAEEAAAEAAAAAARKAEQQAEAARKAEVGGARGLLA